MVSGWSGGSIRNLLAGALVCRLENLERTHETFVYRHERRRIVKLSAVIGCGKERHQLAAGKEFVTVFDYLMGPANEIEIVFVQKGIYNVFAKGEGNTPIVFSPSIDFLVGITPNDVAQQTRIGNVRWPDNVSELFQIGQLGADSSVDAQNFVVDNGRAWQTIEDVREGLPELDRVSSLALVIESVNPVDRGTLVIAANAEKVFRILDLVGQNQDGTLDGLLPAIDIVAQKQVIRVGRKSPVLENPKHIVVLSVNVSNNLDGGSEFQQHWLGHENVSGSQQDHFDFGSGQINEFSWS